MSINARQLKAAIASWEKISTVVSVHNDADTNSAVTDFNTVINSNDIKLDQLSGENSLVDIFDDASASEGGAE